MVGIDFCFHGSDLEGLGFLVSGIVGGGGAAGGGGGDGETGGLVGVVHGGVIVVGFGVEVAVVGVFVDVDGEGLAAVREDSSGVDVFGDDVEEGSGVGSAVAGIESEAAGGEVVEFVAGDCDAGDVEDEGGVEAVGLEGEDVLDVVGEGGDVFGVETLGGVRCFFGEGHGGGADGELVVAVGGVGGDLDSKGDAGDGLVVGFDGGKGGEGVAGGGDEAVEGDVLDFAGVVDGVDGDVEVDGSEFEVFEGVVGEEGDGDEGECGVEGIRGGEVVEGDGFFAGGGGEGDIAGHASGEFMGNGELCGEGFIEDGGEDFGGHVGMGGELVVVGVGEGAVGVLDGEGDGNGGWGFSGEADDAGLLIGDECADGSDGGSHFEGLGKVGENGVDVGGGDGELGGSVADEGVTEGVDFSIADFGDGADGGEVHVAGDEGDGDGGAGFELDFIGLEFAEAAEFFGGGIGGGARGAAGDGDEVGGGEGVAEKLEGGVGGV